MLIMTVVVGAEDRETKELYFPLGFTVNLKLLEDIKCISKK